MSNPLPDFEIPKGDVRPSIRQFLRFAGAANLTGATVKFRYKPEGESTPIVERTAQIIGTPTGGLSAATSLYAQYDWIAGDVAAAGRFEFQWVFTLGDGSTIHMPINSPRIENPDRVWQVFEVCDVI